VAALAAALLAAAAPVTAQARTAPRTPVVVVVFDELPLVSLLGTGGKGGRIDARRYPNFARLARGGTWFPNATTVSDATKTAIPSILDGRVPDRDRPATHRGHPRNLFTLAHRRGYRLRVQEEATSLCPYRGCRRRHGARYFLAHGRVERFRRWIASIDPARPGTLHYKHALIPHVPWVFLPSGQRYDRTVLGPVKGLNSSERSVFDRTLVRQSWQRHLIQVGTADTLVGELLDRLHATGLYNRAAIVVMADHGIGFHVGATDRRTVVRRNLGDIMPIPLFVKRPGQLRGRIDRSLIRTYDVLPTIAAMSPIRVPRGLNGRPAGSRTVRRRGRVKILSRAPVGSLTVSRGRLAAFRNKARRRKNALFGGGLYAIGPNRALLGTPITVVPRRSAGRLRAGLNERSAYTRVRPGNPFLPVHVTGRIRGGRRGARRNVAVAVNGVFQAVSRSVHIRGTAGEYYTFLVPPQSLVRGKNAIEVFTIRRIRGRPFAARIYPSP
jgi:hypothetical protein